MSVEIVRPLRHPCERFITRVNHLETVNLTLLEAAKEAADYFDWLCGCAQCKAKAAMLRAAITEAEKQQ